MWFEQKKLGVILSYLGQVVHILTGILYTPIMLRLLGQSEYGLYQLVNSVVSYLSLLSLGFGSSYVRFYSRYIVKNDSDGIARLNGMFLIIFSAMAVICLLCGGLLLKNTEQIFGPGLTISEISTAKILMTFMIFNLSLTFPNSIFNCVITANEKFIFQKMLLLMQSLFTPFLCLPLLLMGYGSVGMVVVSTFLTVLSFVSNIYYCYTILHIKFIFNNLEFKLLKEIWGFTFFIFLNQIIDQINWSVDKFILGRYIGTASVAIYGLGSQLNSMYLNFSTAISNVFIPKVNKIVASGDDNYQLTLLFTKVGRVQFLILMLILTGFIFFGKPFMYFWGGPEYAMSYYVALLLIVPVTVPLIQNIGIEIQRAKNMHKTRSIIYLIIALINIIVSIPLAKTYHEIGVAIGTAVSLVIGNIIFMNWYYHKYIKLNMLYFWKSIINCFKGLFIPCLYGCLIMLLVSINSIFEMIFHIVIYTCVYSMSIWFLGMNEDEKEIINKPLKAIQKKLKI